MKNNSSQNIRKGKEKKEWKTLRCNYTQIIMKLNKFIPKCYLLSQFQLEKGKLQKLTSELSIYRMKKKIDTQDKHLE